MRVTVFGGGSWGTALAQVLAYSTETAGPVNLLVRDAEAAKNINERHENSRYLPGLRLHEDIRAVLGPEILRESDIWVLSVPVQNQRKALEDVRQFLGDGTIIVNSSKGIELSSLLPLSVTVREALGDPPSFNSRYATLSGPSFAKEVLGSKPTAVVLGCADAELGAYLRKVFATGWFRSYSSLDVRGVELGGAVKNVIAIAAGVSDGLDFGHNARAALITRGLAEITRLGISMGAQQATFMGLSGIGDLMLTCTGDLSRNRQVGLRLGQGQSPAEIVGGLGSVAEGVKTTEAVHKLAKKHGVEMPITASMDALLNGILDPAQAVKDLMSRSLKSEI